MTTEPSVREIVEAASDDLATITEKKRVALAYLSEAWDSAIDEGVDPEIVAHAALFTALCDLVATYGEEAVADLTQTLPKRVRDFEFTVDERSVQ
jgi:hypothetical protein